MTALAIALVLQLAGLMIVTGLVVLAITGSKRAAILFPISVVAFMFDFNITAITLIFGAGIFWTAEKA